MSDGAPAGQNESGSGGPLREKYEGARKVALDLVIQANPGLQASDFNGVEADQFVAHAASVKQQRESALAQQLGVTVDELPAALARARGESHDPPPADNDTPQGRTANLGNLSAPPSSFDPQGDDDRGLTEGDLVEAAFIREAKQQRRS